MRSLERSFLIIQPKREGCGALTILDNAVVYRKYSRRTIAHGLNTLVPKDDYDRADKRTILDQLVARSWLEDGTKGGKKSPTSRANRGARTPPPLSAQSEVV